MAVLVGDDAHAGADQGVVADIDATGAVDDAEVVDLDAVAQAHAAVAALHVGIAVERHLVAEADAGAARGIHRGIGVDLAPAAELGCAQGP
jgi:hypothetical protein